MSGTLDDSILKNKQDELNMRKKKQRKKTYLVNINKIKERRYNLH